MPETNEKPNWKVMAENEFFRMERLNNTCRLLTKDSPFVPLIFFGLEKLNSFENIFSLAAMNYKKHEEKEDITSDFTG